MNGNTAMVQSKLFDSKLIADAACEELSALHKFDSHGIFPAPGENGQQFAQRISKLGDALKDLEKKLSSQGVVEVAPGIKISSKCQISNDIYSEALNTAYKLYNVRPDWVPGFFADESFGVFWGGCALSDMESKLVLFIIRKVFARKRRFLLYDRCELMAHELIHAAHQSIDEWQFEEYFAYRCAKSFLRRYSGSCFIRKYDALFFLLPIMLLPVMQFLTIFNVNTLPMWIFWVLAGVYPLYLFVRCVSTAFLAEKARRTLRKNNIKAVDAVLFRLTVEEIKTLARGKMPQGSDLRWQILKKFYNMKAN